MKITDSFSDYGLHRIYTMEIENGLFVDVKHVLYKSDDGNAEEDY